MQHGKDHHPLFVAQIGETVAGYGCLSEFSARAAYDITAELSVYVGKNYWGRGVASALMTELIKYAKEDEKLHRIISIITSDNEVSIHLHKKFGFKFAGTLPEVGYKFNRFLSVDYYVLEV